MRQSTRLLRYFGGQVPDGSDSAETVESAVDAALLCLCSRPSQQRQWFLRCHGLRAFLATVTLQRRASLRLVSWGVWRKVSNPEVLRLFFCERRMRCGFVWCISYSSQWTGQVPGSCFLDKDVDVPVLATSWGCRTHRGYGELFRAVCTGTRPGLTPIRAGKGWRGPGSLLPGVLPPNLLHVDTRLDRHGVF